MGDGGYFYRVYSLEGAEQLEEEGQLKEDTLSKEKAQLLDSYAVHFMLEYAGYRMFPNFNVRSEVVPDFKEHIEQWLTDAELIIATDVMMDWPNNILFSTSEKSVQASTYYDQVWARMKDETAAFEQVCPEISFPTDENWIQKRICWAVDEQIAVAKYYDTKAGGNCVLHAGSYTEKELLQNVEDAHALYPGELAEQHCQVETISGEKIDIFSYEIPFENGEYKKTVMTFWTYNDKTYTIFGHIAKDADATSIVDTAIYIVEHMK